MTSINLNPILKFSGSEKEQNRLINSVQVLEESVKNGSILKSHFADYKSRINWNIETSFRNLIEHFYSDVSDSEERQNQRWKLAFDLSPRLNNISGRIKSFANEQKEMTFPSDVVNAVNEFYDTVVKLAKLAERAKEVIQVKKPSENKEQKERRHVDAVLSTSDAFKQVKELLEKLVDSQYNSLVKLFETKYLSYAEQYKEYYNKLENKRTASAYACFKSKNFLNEEGYSVVSKLINHKDYQKNLLDNYKELVNALAIKRADEIREMFVGKNLVKIVNIFDKKDNLETAKIIGSGVDMRGLTGRFKFDFKDGASFIIDNKVVFSYSKYNTPFYRFPLTFHNVINSDGSEMSQPSHEKMVHDFF